MSSLQHRFDTLTSTQFKFVFFSFGAEEMFQFIVIILQLPASKPWKPEWKENVFAMYNGSEDRVQYWQAR